MVDRPAGHAGFALPGIDDLQLIGRGGSATVYRGRQTSLHRDVAVKVLAAGTGRFAKELRAVGSLSGHPHVVPVYDAGELAGQQYLVMPYLSGGSLEDRLSSGPLSPPEVVRIAVAVADALASAHRLGILHRDVKPANVLFDSYGEPQLADFGIARFTDSTRTYGLVHATVAYAAPEVLAGKPATAAADTYSLGATLHAALRGAAPYVARPHEAEVAFALRVMQSEPPALDGAAPALAEVVRRAMAKDPAQRYATAADMAVAAAAAGAGDLAAQAGAALPRSGGARPQAWPAALASRAGGPAAPPSGPGRPDAPPSGPGRTGRRRLLVGAAGTIAALVLAGGLTALLVDGPDGGRRPVGAPAGRVSSTRSSRPSTTINPTTTNPPTTSPPTTAPPSTTPPSTAAHRSAPPSSAAHSSAPPSPGAHPSTSTPPPSTAPPSAPTGAPTRGTHTSRSTTAPPRQKPGPPGHGNGVLAGAGAAPGALQAYVRDYYDLVDRHALAQSWAWLSPAYQQRLGYGYYQRFWSSVRSVDLLSVVAGPGDQATITIDYHLASGANETERAVLSFTSAGAGGRRLIDNTTVVS